MDSRRLLGIGELGLRLAASFVGVALAAVLAAVLFSNVTIGTAVDQLLRQQQTELARATAATAATAYDATGWRASDLSSVTDLVSSDGAAAQVTNMAGRMIGSTPGFARYGADAQLRGPILHHGRQVGWIAVRFGSSSLVAAIGRFQAQRWRAWIMAAGIAALLALAVSLAITRLITEPLERLLAAVRARGAGARSVRIADIRAVGVLRELLEGFNYAADRLDRLERLRRNLVADVAHGLRTPVAVLQAGHEAMLDGVAEPTPESLGSLRDEVLRLARMVEDLQRLSAAESAAIQLKLAPQDLAALAADAAASLGDRFEAAGVYLEQRLTPVQVTCDWDKMREVITNLLTNALKFTPADGSVRLDVWPEGREHARVRVSDTGIGIGPEELPRVTERFFRGEGSAAMAGGSGIGLTIVAELVQAHNGELAITSEPRHGTQVMITLPQLCGEQSAGRWRRSRVVAMRLSD